MFLKKPDAKFQKGLREFRSIALLNVFSKWYTTVLVNLLHEEKEPFPRGSRERGQWRAHAGPGKEKNPETLGVAGRRTDRFAARFYRYNTTFMASLDVKTAFDVAKPSVVSRILTLTRSHGHVAAAWQRCKTFEARPASRIVRRSSDT